MVSVHLSTKTNKQTVEAQRLVELIQEYFGVNSLSQIADYLVMAGDFNAATGHSQVVQIFVKAGLLDEPVPVDQLGDDTTNQPRSKRHDFVLQNQVLLNHHQPTVFYPPQTTTYPTGLVLDTRVFTPISAVYPAQEQDTGVDGMQHLAVVKDFAF
jgi:endonuclease/exonuclease/phosphatase family metal-dependent hydrolase